MNNNNKILTVSYGTFSCTLEGFDDSFGTMKAIAEYFRDLAADDRYFGAEPPQPDADMLARIAQREVSRRVEAHEHDGRIMLKAHEEPEEQVADAVEAAPVGLPVAAPDTARQAPSAAPPQAQSELEESEAPALVDEEIVADTTADAEKPPRGEALAKVADTPAEKIVSEQIEPQAAAGSIKIKDAPAIDDTSDDDITEKSIAGPVSCSTAEDASQIPDEETIQAPLAKADDQDDVAAFFAERVTADQVDKGVEEEPLIDTGPAFTPTTEDKDVTLEEFETEEIEAAPKILASESLAEKLQRIRAVVSEQADEMPETDYTEDIEQPASMQGFEEFDTLVSAPDVDQPMVQEASEELPNDAPNEIVVEAAQDIIGAFDLDDARGNTQSTASTSNIDDDDEGDDLDALLRRIEAGEDAPENKETVDLSAEIEDDEEPAENLFVETEEDFEESDIYGRVMKVNRADLESALEAGDLQEVAIEQKTAGINLSAEDSFALQNDVDGFDDDESAAAAQLPAAHESLPNIDNESDEDVSRLMAEADQQMQEPEGKTRRSAFAHLRAAVAARFADRSMDQTDEAVEEAAKAYRSDLAEVVKPRRPVASSRSERPSDERPAPLKLVAEQRVDSGMTSLRGPVSPRRVAAPDDHDLETAEDTGFADYAQEHRAKTLPELLEAAAAYLAHVEGHEQFSRPQLMSRVRQADCGDFSREDGLRSFGQLLRTGKIEKIKAGRFSASEAIGFKPDHRAAG